ncbi:Hageman factor inhibitor [Panicum miliaceum]|uniref:Hageman factor inhibitor n=1 Tax=Panicum miliaceum TaxID=4540 RepID=A0A3L6T9Z8_PANMI|nr:Hageman factor inhibitor [Panicum miliaceum]
MASSSHLLLSAAVLLAVLAAAAASAATYCVPGLAIPHNPLPSCRTYVTSRTCDFGPRLPLPAMRRRCCWELEEIPAYCRCAALSVLMDGVIPPGGGQLEGRLPDLPGCPREAQRRFAATLVTEAECNLTTIGGAPECPWILGEETMPSK